MYNPNYNKQNYPFFRSDFFIDKIKRNNGFHQIILKIRKFIMFRELSIIMSPCTLTVLQILGLTQVWILECTIDVLPSQYDQSILFVVTYKTTKIRIFAQLPRLSLLRLSNVQGPRTYIYHNLETTAVFEFQSLKVFF